MPLVRRLSIFFVASFALNTAAATETIINLWDGPVGTVGHTETSEDRHETGRIDRWVSHVTEPTLTIYPAGPRKDPGPAVLVIPGGGFWYVRVDEEGVEPAHWLNSLGLTAAVLKYRTLEPQSERTPQTIEPIFADALRAMRQLRAHARDLQIDPERIGVMGFSAGGAMALRLTTSVDDPVEDKLMRYRYTPDFVAIVYGGIPPRLGPPMRPLPPFFIVHAFDDPKAPVDVTSKIASYIRAGGGSLELHIFQHGGHGFGVMPANESTSLWTDLFGAWYRGMQTPTQ